jgi:hypothetical protein
MQQINVVLSLLRREVSGGSEPHKKTLHHCLSLLVAVVCWLFRPRFGADDQFPLFVIYGVPIVNATGVDWPAELYGHVPRQRLYQFC